MNGPRGKFEREKIMICRSCDKIMIPINEYEWQCPRCGAIIWQYPKTANRPKNVWEESKKNEE